MTPETNGKRVPGSRRPVRQLIASMGLLIIVVLSQACGQVAPASPTAPAAAAPTPAAVPASPTVQAVSPSPTLPAPSPTVTAAPTAIAVPPAPTPDLTSDNVFATILGPAAAPPDWRVRPCDGDGPLLCIFAGRELVGRIELSLWHLETHSDFQALLKQQGLTPGAIDYRNPEHAPKIAAAMRGFVDQYHGIFEQDRQTTYGDTRTYTRLETQPAQVGTIPGVRYGFVMTDQAGTVRERWLSFAAFDGTLLYILVPHYDPNSYFSFTSDADLQRFEPFLPHLMAGLRLPLPVQDTTVKEVVTQAGMPVPAPLFRFYAVGSNPVAELPPAQTLQVTGQSPNQRWWRVVCPDDKPGECWVSADPKVTQPKTP